MKRLKNHYKHYSSEQKVSFWTITVNFFLVAVTFGMGVLIQDSMMTKTQELNNRLLAVEYSKTLIPLTERFYTPENVELVSKLFTIEKYNDADSISDVINNIYNENPSRFINLSDSILPVVSTLSLYWPEKQDDIQKLIARQIICSATLKEIENIENHDSLLYLDKEGGMLAYLMRNTYLWKHAGAVCVYSSQELIKQYEDSLKSAKMAFDISEQNFKRDIDNCERPDSNIINLCKKTCAMELHNKTGKSMLVHELSKYTLQTMYLVTEFSTPPSTEWGIKDLLSTKWVIFGFCMLIAIGLSILFTLFIFPKKF